MADRVLTGRTVMGSVDSNRCSEQDRGLALACLARHGALDVVDMLGLVEG